MAILHRKEEKIQVVLGRLPKKYTHEEFVEMFIKLYSKDWGKIKSAYVKQSQDKEPGTVVNMPKPDLYLKQILETYLATTPSKPEIIEKKEVVKIEETPVVKTKTTQKKKAVVVAEAEEPVKKAKAAPKKKEVVATKAEPVKQTKAVTKKKVEATVEPATAVKKKAPAKKKVELAETTPVKERKAKTTEK